MHVDCITSRVFCNKNLQAKHEYFSQRVPKSTAISWFHKAKAFQHVVHNLSYAQVLAKGSNSKYMVSLDKRPYQHMLPPISNNRVKKGLNPNNKVSDRSKGGGGGGKKICNQKVDNLQSPLFHANSKNSFPGKRSVTDCGSVASGSVATNTLVQQGISTSNKFAALMEDSREDDFASFQDDLPSDSSNSHVNGTTPTRTIVSVTSRSPRLPTGSYLKNHVELPQCQPLFVGKTYDFNDLRKTSFKGNKNKMWWRIGNTLTFHL